MDKVLVGVTEGALAEAARVWGDAPTAITASERLLALARAVSPATVRAVVALATADDRRAVARAVAKLSAVYGWEGEGIACLSVTACGLSAAPWRVCDLDAATGQPFAAASAVIDAFMSRRTPCARCGLSFPQLDKTAATRLFGGRVCTVAPDANGVQRRVWRSAPYCRGCMVASRDDRRASAVASAPEQPRLSARVAPDVVGASPIVEAIAAVSRASRARGPASKARRPAKP